MTDKESEKLLTHGEYQAIAGELNLPCNAFIDGRFQPAKSKKRFASINPATGRTIAEIAACDSKDVDFAVNKARCFRGWPLEQAASGRTQADPDSTRQVDATQQS
jgi:hypothetical protein